MTRTATDNEKESNSFKSVLIMVIIFTIGAVIFLYTENKKKEQIDKVGLDDLNLQLVGIVDSIDNGKNYHGYGIVRLKIIESNVQDYDPRSSQKFYFCVIKNGIAEIYTHTFIDKIDTVKINTKDRTIATKKNGRFDTGSISIYADKDYYNYIKQKTVFK